MDRPHPPASLLELSDLSDLGLRLTPAPEHGHFRRWLGWFTGCGEDPQHR